MYGIYGSDPFDEFRPPPARDIRGRLSRSASESPMIPFTEPGSPLANRESYFARYPIEHGAVNEVVDIILIFINEKLNV